MRIVNKKASFEYILSDRFEAGVSLLGSEVKSLKSGHASLDGAFVKIINGEAYIINAQIFPYEHARPDKYDPKRTRKLLLHKKELLKISMKAKGENLTVVPVSWYNKGPRIKLEIAIAKGKKQYEKRASKKKEIEKRDLERQFRGKIK